MFDRVKPGDTVRLPGGAAGTIKREAWGRRWVIERESNLEPGKMIEVILFKDEVKKVK